MSRGRRLLVGAVALAALAAVAVSVVAARSGGGVFTPPPGALLPDLDPAAPTQLQTRIVAADDGLHVLLSFRSAAENVGKGVLWIRGSRPNVGSETMDAEQVIRLADGSTVTKAGVGSMRYIVDPTHQHWHLEPFMIYELRRLRDFRLMRPDEKTGFCLGDRYAFDATPPAPPEFLTNCGLGDTTLSAIEEGISPGYGDDYRPWLDGQWIDITGLKGGRYVLVHRVNVGHLLAESSYANNASSVTIALAWPTGKQGLPSVRVLRTCPKKARCPVR